MDRILRMIAVAALVLAAGMRAGATTYETYTFEQLVARADVIFVGEVVDVTPFLVRTREGAVIKTRVIFRVADPLQGTAAALEVFDFFGGELDGIGMAIAEMPRFARGDRRVVFARRERSINPIVGFTQGLLWVTTDDTGIDRVWTAEGRPLTSTSAIGTRAGIPRTLGVPMRLSQFRDEIVRALSRVRQQ